MIKKLRVTVDGKPYDVTIEVEEETPKATAAPAAASTAPAVPATPPPVSTPEVTHSVGAAHDAIVSPLSGRVTAITVTVGQVVKQEEHVLTLEAMKMNTFVFAQKGGKVKEIKVEVGDAVHENQPLIILE